LALIIGTAADARVAEAGGLGAPVSREGAFNGDEAGTALGTPCVRVDTFFSDEAVLVCAAGGGAEPPILFFTSSVPV